MNEIGCIRPYLDPGPHQVEQNELEFSQVGREVVGEVEIEELPVSEEGVAEAPA